MNEEPVPIHTLLRDWGWDPVTMNKVTEVMNTEGLMITTTQTMKSVVIPIIITIIPTGEETSTPIIMITRVTVILIPRLPVQVVMGNIMVPLAKVFLVQCMPIRVLVGIKEVFVRPVIRTLTVVPKNEGEVLLELIILT